MNKIDLGDLLVDTLRDHPRCTLEIGLYALNDKLRNALWYSLLVSLRDRLDVLMWRAPRNVT